MRVGIIQSAYIPWRGYFDFINSVDLFILLDDVMYPRARSWRNRNQIKLMHGLKWINIPLQPNPHHLPIDQVKISGDGWKSGHSLILREAFNCAPYFYDVEKIFQEVTTPDIDSLSTLNHKFISTICDYFEIKTKIIQSRELNVTGSKTDKLINLLKSVGATNYLSGPAAKNYLNENLFREHKIQLEYKVYEYSDYPQLWGDFQGAITVLDLIANCGFDGKYALKSQQPNIIVMK